MVVEKGEEMVRDAGSGLVVQEVMLMTVGGESLNSFNVIAKLISR